jgi:hypothetical protein
VVKANQRTDSASVAAGAFFAAEAKEKRYEDRSKVKNDAENA